MGDHRMSARRRVFKDGVIQSNGVGAKCVIRNISETGALVVADPETIADTFNLAIVSENLVRKCKVVWRDRDKMGVMFV